jgi:uncharacterized protein YbjT (DUF2867 family)
MKVLLVDGEGKLGRAVAKELAKQGIAFRCLVGRTSDTAFLESLGCELVYGDVRSTGSLENAMADTDMIISSFATGVQARQAADLWNVDYAGNLSLIELAKANRVKKYVFVSCCGRARLAHFEHGKVSKAVEDLLKMSGLDYTVLRVATLATDLVFMGDTLKKRGWAPTLKRKRNKVRPVFIQDLAKCLVGSLDNPKASRKVIELGGNAQYSFKELEDLYSKALKRKVRFVQIPLPIARFIAATVDYITADRYNARGLVSALSEDSACNATEARRILDTSSLASTAA